MLLQLAWSPVVGNQIQRTLLPSSFESEMSRRRRKKCKEKIGGSKLKVLPAT